TLYIVLSDDPIITLSIFVKLLILFETLLKSDIHGKFINVLEDMHSKCLFRVETSFGMIELFNCIC
ncbi:hypothetical protein LOTGIDRAFT_144944, partial [Lottia gigantea]